MSSDELPGGYMGGADNQEGDSAPLLDAAPPVPSSPAVLAGSRRGSQERGSRRGSNAEQRLLQSVSNVSAAALEARNEQQTTWSALGENSRRSSKSAVAADEGPQAAESSGAGLAAAEDGRKMGSAPGSPACASVRQLSGEAVPADDRPTLCGFQQQHVEEQQYKTHRQPQYQQPPHYQQQHDQYPEQYGQQPQQWRHQQRRHQLQPEQDRPQYPQQLSNQHLEQPLPRLRQWPSREWKSSEDESQRNRPLGSSADGGSPVEAAPPFVHILHQHHQQKPSPAHTTEAEIHFIGELEAGQGFCSSGGLFCEFSFEAGNHWLSLCRAAEKTHQTQTAYGSVGDLYVWNHPIDLHYALSSVVGWPRCRLSIWKLNAFGQVENVSYGTITLPTTAGHHEFTCQTWTPLGTYSEEFASRFLGRRTELDSLDVLDSRIGDRMKLTTRSSGQVLFVLDVIQRNFEYHGLTSCSQYPAANIGSNICLAFTRPEPPSSLRRSGTGEGTLNEQQQKPELRTLGTNSSYSKLSETGQVLDAPTGTEQLFDAPRRGLSGAMCPVSPRGKVSSKKKKK